MGVLGTWCLYQWMLYFPWHLSCLGFLAPVCPCKPSYPAKLSLCRATFDPEFAVAVQMQFLL